MNKQSVVAGIPKAVRGESAYNREQVDEFLQRARNAYENENADVAFSAADIRKTAFSLSREGYSARHVDAALDRLEDVFFEREKRQILRSANADVENWRREIRNLAREVAQRAVRPRGHKFRRRSFMATGYKRSQVDAFVERAAAALAGQAKITAAQVREVVFHSEVRGYDELQVDVFLDAIVQLLLAER